jgi:hypothetical protein
LFLREFPDNCSMIHPYRRRNLLQVANRLGFSFHDNDDWGLESQLQDFRLFKKGYKGEVERILRKQDGLMEFDISIFDYRYKNWGGGSGKDKYTYQTVFFLQSAKLSLPELLMRPETLGDKFLQLLGVKDINFVRYPKFSGQYKLTGDDQEYIRHHFTDEVLEYFTINEGWTVEGLGFYLLIYKSGTLMPSAQVEDFFKRGQQIYRLLTDEDAQNRIFGT